MSGPTISVVIPLHDAAPYVGAAIESVLAQDVGVEEIVVVDDGSTDDGLQVASRYPRVTGLRQENRGAAAARNRGLDVARGEWIAFLDADDLWPAGRLRLLLTGQLAQPQPGLLFGAMEEFVSPDVPPELAATMRVASGPNQFGVPTCGLVHRSLFERVGPLDVQWRAGEMIDWVLRAGAAGVGQAHIPDTVLRRRLHANNHGRRNRAAYQDLARIVLAARRRGSMEKTC